MLRAVDPVAPEKETVAVNQQTVTKETFEALPGEIQINDANISSEEREKLK